MKITEQSHKIEFITKDAVRFIEKIARTCYKSEGKIKRGSAVKLIKALIDRGHEAMLEHASMTVRFITDRGVSHELVRHRLCSFAQESTRYVKYDGEMEFIKPTWYVSPSIGFSSLWPEACEISENHYHDMIKMGAKPQQARQVLNNSVKTEIVVTANIREWRKIFSLRAHPSAHPQMWALMSKLLVDCRLLYPVLFADVGQIKYDDN